MLASHFLSRRKFRRVEYLFEHLVAVVKNSFQIRSHEQFLHDGAAGDGIFDAITDECSTVLLLKSMFVNP